LLSQGTPMISAGDEVLRTQRGNNNAYCQDNAISWFDWKLVEQNAEMLRFCQALIAFRKEQPNVRRATFLTGTAGEDGALPDVSWYGANGKSMDWNQTSKSILCIFGSAGLDDPTVRPVMLLMHAGETTQDFVIPPDVRSLPWTRFIDTSVEAPADICPALDGPPLPSSGQVRLIHHTLMCYVA
jgi:isoamylase